MFYPSQAFIFIRVPPLMFCRLLSWRIACHEYSDKSWTVLKGLDDMQRLHGDYKHLFFPWETRAYFGQAKGQWIYCCVWESGTLVVYKVCGYSLLEGPPDRIRETMLREGRQIQQLSTAGVQESGSVGNDFVVGGQCERYSVLANDFLGFSFKLALQREISGRPTTLYIESESPPQPGPQSCK